MSITRALQNYAKEALDYFADVTPQLVADSDFSDRPAAIAADIRDLYKKGNLDEVFSLETFDNEDDYQLELLMINDFREDLATRIDALLTEKGI